MKKKEYNQECSYLKSQINSAEDLMYEAKDRAVNALKELIEWNEARLYFKEPFLIIGTDHTGYFVDSIAINEDGNVCICEEDKFYGFHLFDTPTVIEFCHTVADIMASYIDEYSDKMDKEFKEYLEGK